MQRRPVLPGTVWNITDSRLTVNLALCILVFISNIQYRKSKHSLLYRIEIFQRNLFLFVLSLIKKLYWNDVRVKIFKVRKYKTNNQSSEYWCHCHITTKVTTILSKPQRNYTGAVSSVNIGIYDKFLSSRYYYKIHLSREKDFIISRKASLNLSDSLFMDICKPWLV